MGWPLCNGPRAPYQRKHNYTAHLRAVMRSVLLRGSRHRTAQLRQRLQEEPHRLRQLLSAPPRLLQLGSRTLRCCAVAGGSGLQAR